MKIGICMLLLMGLTASLADARPAKDAKSPGVKMRAFGKIRDGREARLYTLSNKSGMEVVITDFGATVVSIKVPDRNGKLGDVVFGYDTLEGY